MDAVMREHRGSLVRLRSLKPKPENNFNHQRKRTFLLEDADVEGVFDRRFHVPYFGRKASSVTKLYHQKPPAHSYHPSVRDTPPGCYNRKASSITDFVEHYSRAKRKSDDIGWFGRTATDVSVHQRIIPCPHYGKRTDVPAPWYGRLATPVTDPYRYPGDPTWMSILHHCEEVKRNPKYPTSRDQYPVCPQHVSPGELRAAVAAKKQNQYVVAKAWMTSVDRDRLEKQRLLGLIPGATTGPTACKPPYALGSVASTKSIQSKARAEHHEQEPDSISKADAKPASSVKSQTSACKSSHAHRDGHNGDGAAVGSDKSGSHRTHHSGEKLNSPPPISVSSSASKSPAGSKNVHQPSCGDPCNSPRSELLSPTSEKSYKSSQKSPPPAPGSSNSSKSENRRQVLDDTHSHQSARSHTTSNSGHGQGSASKRSGGCGSSSCSSATSQTGCKSTGSKSKGNSSCKDVPFDPDSITCKDLEQFPDICATTSAWGGKFKDRERNKPWPVPYEQPHERHTHRKTSITQGPIVN